MYNCNEYLEAQYGCIKTRGVPINVNYRYLDDELWYLLDNSDSEALFFHSSLGDRVARVLDRLPEPEAARRGRRRRGRRPGRPGASAYEDLIAAHEPMPRIERAEDDIYMLYTGGTTGMPKGVMYATGGMAAGLIASGFPLLGRRRRPTDAAEVAGIVKARHRRRQPAGLDPVRTADARHRAVDRLRSSPTSPAATSSPSPTAASTPHEVLATVERHRVNAITIVGDSFAKPIIRALDEGKPDGSPYDTSSIEMISSSGVMWTTEVKEQLLDRIEQAMLVDAMGSTEGSMGTQISMKGMTADTAKFTQAPTTKVFTDDDREVQPGSDEVGMVAAGGNVPIGYYKDPEKSARTFRVIDGVRYSFPGDFAKVAADGTLILLGRGSQVINTGGEKVFPEEVEEAVKRVDGVVDCLVVGVDDEKFGQAVTAVVSLADGRHGRLGERSSPRSRTTSPGYKAPKSVIFVDQVPRAPNGKADYRAAKEHADAAG